MRTGGSQRPVLRACTAALLALCAACASQGEVLDPATGIEVRVLKAPTQPVVREGEDDSAPVAGAVVAIEPSAGGTMRRASTDSAGVVRLQVPAGTHRVSVEACPGAMSLPKQAELVSVSAGAYTAVTLVCDTGIR